MAVVVADFFPDDPADHAGEHVAADQEHNDSNEVEPELAVQVEDVDRDEAQEKRQAQPQAEEALNELGFNVGTARPPLIDLNDAEKDRLRAVLAKYEFDAFLTRQPLAAKA